MPDFDVIDAAVIEVFGEELTYRPGGGGAVTPNPKGFFQDPDDEPDTEAIDFISTSPQVTLTGTDAPSPTKQDLFTINGQDYTVKDFEDDESLLVVFLLLKA